jgi:zinc protease
MSPRPTAWARPALTGVVLAAAVLSALAGLVTGRALPAAAQASAPPVTRETLPNGLIALVRENPTAPVVAMSVMVRMGTLVETPATAGISNLLQLMLVRGTTTRSGTQIVEEADRLGGSIDAYGDSDYGEIAATALARNWRPMLELVADVAQRPSLPESTLEAVRNFLLFQIRNRGDKPIDAGLDTLYGALFGANPYAWDPLGRKESVERLGRDAIMEHYRRYYRGGEVVLVVSGRVKSAEVMPEVRRLFGEMPGGRAAAVTLAAPPAPETARQAIRVQGAQAQILMGMIGPTFTEADHAPLKVLATVLGGGLAGRFFSELRDKQGLAYTTAAQYPMRFKPGPFYAFLGTAPANVERAEAALREQLERVQREPVSDEELRVAKAYLLGSLAMDRRTNARQAWYMASYELAGVGYDYFDRYTTRVKDVTAGDVQRVARRSLDKIRTVVVQPPS